MKRINYTLRFSIDACKALPCVGEMFDRLNLQLTTLNESKVGLRVQVCQMDVSVLKPLSRKEKETFMKAAESVLHEHMPELSIRCDSMRRKSRNSRSQPV